MTIALVTGGNRGLGRASALALAEQGVDVVLTYRSGADAAADVVDQIQRTGRTAAALPLDVSDADGFDAFATSLAATLRDTFGAERVDLLLNNAGHAAGTPLGETDAETLDSLFAVHVKGVFLLTQALLPLLADGGRILNVSSGLARFTNPGSYSAYGAMKGAVEVLTRYWALELGQRGITVNVVAPGPVATDFGGGAVRDTPQLRERLGQDAALGRVGEADDIGPVVATMLTGGLGWVTGQRLEASGGTKL
jgi:NAD(P)-dependent dehydrogenase (short-subunit alcohol dehydrogenase family)